MARGGLWFPTFSEALVLPCGDFSPSPAIPFREGLCSPGRNPRGRLDPRGAGSQQCWIPVSPAGQKGFYCAPGALLGLSLCWKSLLVFGVWGCGENIPLGSELRPEKAPVPWGGGIQLSLGGIQLSMGGIQLSMDAFSSPWGIPTLFPATQLPFPAPSPHPHTPGWLRSPLLVPWQWEMSLKPFLLQQEEELELPRAPQVRPGESCPCCSGGHMAQPWWLQLPVSSFSQEVLPGWSWDGFFLLVLCHPLPITLFSVLENKPSVFCLTFQR